MKLSTGGAGLVGNFLCFPIAMMGSMVVSASSKDRTHGMHQGGLRSDQTKHKEMDGKVYLPQCQLDSRVARYLLSRKMGVAVAVTTREAAKEDAGAQISLLRFIGSELLWMIVDSVK
ncbi:hypothetical protein EDD18DRAFT_1111431 [Armillaria luteobubalina]|uniref:Uncharacterized protein n=1 Tax=Armillaria luteobubalina TaxID=153913 RepID=A0AA39PKC7_9AGAR|nr:hypothetical protein EDD18DRAFT_1111431 [Armillaria luteobubalina]